MQWVPGHLPGVKRPGREVTISLHLVPRVRPVCLNDVDRENLFLHRTQLSSVFATVKKLSSHSLKVNTSLSS